MNNKIAEILWKQVNDVAQKTNCKDRAVGCVIYNVKLNKIVGYGHNKHLNGVCDCHSTKTAQHAEVSAINSMEQTYDRKDLIAFVDHQPCFNCASALETVVNEVRYRSQK